MNNTNETNWQKHNKRDGRSFAFSTALENNTFRFWLASNVTQWATKTWSSSTTRARPGPLPAWPRWPPTSAGGGRRPKWPRKRSKAEPWPPLKTSLGRGRPRKTDPKVKAEAADRTFLEKKMDGHILAKLRCSDWVSCNFCTWKLILSRTWSYKESHTKILLYAGIWPFTELKKGHVTNVIGRIPA